MHRVLTLNTLCSIASIYFATQHNRFFSEPPTFFEENNVLSILWTTLFFARYCVTFSQVRWAILQSTSVKYRLTVDRVIKKWKCKSFLGHSVYDHTEHMKLCVQYSHIDVRKFFSNRDNRTNMLKVITEQNDTAANVIPQNKKINTELAIQWVVQPWHSLKAQPADFSISVCCFNRFLDKTNFSRFLDFC